MVTRYTSSEVRIQSEVITRLQCRAERGKEKTYFDESSGNTSLASVGTNTVGLGLGNNGTSVLGLDGIETRQVGTSLKIVGLCLDVGEVKSRAVLSGGGRDGADGEETENVGELHFE